METTLHRKKATAEDYKKLPEGSMYQLINGELVMAPAPKKTHQEILGDIFSLMHQYAGKENMGKVYPSSFDIHFDEENIFQPDICFISTENLKNFHEDGYYYGAPDVVIEILSPSNAIDDFTKKFRIYEKYGVMEYFIVDPDSKDVISYYLLQNKYQEIYRESGVIISKVLNQEFRF